MSKKPLVVKPTQTETARITKLEEDLALAQREIQHLQELFSEMKTLLTLVSNLKEPLQTLDEMKFTLQLFKVIALKS